MNYCIEKGIKCNNADYQGWCTSTKCCDKTISGGKGNSITYTIKHDNTAALWNTLNGCSISTTKPFEVKEDGIYKLRQDLGKGLYELVMPKETFIEAFEKYCNKPEQEKTLKPITNNYCSMCEFNDGPVYTSMPPKYKCTKTGEWHEDDHKCNVIEASHRKRRGGTAPNRALSEIEKKSANIAYEAIKNGFCGSCEKSSCDNCTAGEAREAIVRLQKCEK